MPPEPMTSQAEARRSLRLKAATARIHDRLDEAIMRKEPFRDLARYGRFLELQYLFHRDVAVLYNAPELTRLFADLPDRLRLDFVCQDLRDLDLPLLLDASGPAFDNSKAVDMPTALGWLYVAEGSTLGAAFLLKEVQKLGLSKSFGARHLSAAPQGRGLQWRKFTAAMDAVVLSAEQEARVTAGARAAFERVRGLVDDAFA